MNGRIGEILGDFLGDQYGTGRSIGDGRAVEELHGPGHDGVCGGVLEEFHLIGPGGDGPSPLLGLGDAGIHNIPD